MGLLERLRDRARTIGWRASALGVITVAELLLLLAAVVVLTIQAFAINRLAGIPYPLWNPLKEQEGRPKQSG